MKKLTIAILTLLITACSDQPSPDNKADVEAFLKSFDCKQISTFKFDDEELARRTRIYCAMKTERTPSKPERHTFG